MSKFINVFYIGNTPEHISTSKASVYLKYSFQKAPCKPRQSKYHNLHQRHPFLSSFQKDTQDQYKHTFHHNNCRRRKKKRHKESCYKSHYNRNKTVSANRTPKHFSTTSETKHIPKPVQCNPPILIYAKVCPYVTIGQSCFLYCLWLHMSYTAP